MKLRDIVNRDRVTLTNCESEPIHIPGAIQPHGMLLGLSGPEYLLEYCSGNTATFCGFTPEQLLGKTFAACFGEEETKRLADYLSSEDYTAGNPARMQLGGTPFSCNVRRSDQNTLLLEAEPFPDGYLSAPDLYRQTRKFVLLLERSQSLKDLCQAIAEETRAITGYDRVMIYRFDEEYNGEVIAESLDERLEPFLNLHYPHTDIPAQARDLYLRNLMRIIVDVHYQPVPIFTIDDRQGKNLDLTYSVLRSVSPIHLEYLANMGVGATLTISLIHEKKLWGLIACHHYAPKNIPHYTRLSAQLQGHFLTSQVAVREMNERFEAGKANAACLEALVPEVTRLSEGDIAAFVDRPELLRLAGASGVAIFFNGQLFGAGTVPGKEAIASLAVGFAKKSAEVFITSTMMRDEGASFPADPLTAGVQYYALTPGGAHYIMWFRREEQEEVMWAGDPSKAINKDEKGLSPRKSFEQWRQLTKGKSKPWTESERTAASALADALQKQFGLLQLSAEEQRYRLLSEQLQSANDELERINWISTHDLQEPLRKIQVFASRILGSKEAEATNFEIVHAVERMNAAANRMQTLVTDIHAYSKLLHQQAPLKTVDLNVVVDEVLQDLAEEIGEHDAVVLCESLPVVSGEPFLVRQVFTNLLRNALKFTKEGVKPRISITARYLEQADDPQVPERPGGYQQVSISDNGIGFSNEFAESIFVLFRRLHSQQEFGGTGIGLALCRKVMQRHNGYITARALPEKGANFLLWFPA